MRILIQRRDGFLGWSTQLSECQEAARWVGCHSQLVERIAAYRDRLRAQKEIAKWLDITAAGPMKMDDPLLVKIQGDIKARWGFDFDINGVTGLYVFEVSPHTVVGYRGKQEYIVMDGKPLPDKIVEFV